MTDCAGDAIMQFITTQPKLSPTAQAGDMQTVWNVAATDANDRGYKDGTTFVLPSFPLESLPL